MSEEISLPVSLDIIIPTIVVALITTLVPYFWNKQKENFQNKLKIIEEHNLFEKNLYPLSSFYTLINWKYREPIVKNNDLLWKMRIEPLDDKKHLKLEVENIMEKFSKLKEIFLKISATEKMVIYYYTKLVNESVV